MKIETITFEYQHCGECPNTISSRDTTKWYCEKMDNKKIPDLWGEIPKWCPLEDKAVESMGGL